MRQNRVIFWSGVLIAIMPFLGFPGSWKTLIYFFAGLLVASYPSMDFLRNRMGTNFHQYRARHNDQTFVENTEILENNSK